jgi:phosphatidate cytidylyltransferase
VQEQNGAPKQARSNLSVRLLTVLAAGPLLLALLFLGPPWAWALLVALSAGQVTRELLAMTHPEDRASRWVGALLTVGLSAALSASADEPRRGFSALALVLVVSALLPLLRPGDIPGAALRTLGGLAAPVYVGVLLTTLALLRQEQGPRGPLYVLLSLTIAWMGDTGGYVFGRLWGKTKLYERVSPKKTREGLLGSVLFAVGAALAASLGYLPELPVAHAVGLGLVGALLGTAGDLFESLLKRSTGVKDSGSILPGHGGLFDRIDALLVVSPLVYVYTLWLG